jgi:hypothetical protein
MNVLVQHLETRMYLAEDGLWIKSKEDSLLFPDAMNAIAFCIQKALREVRLVTQANSTETEVHFYPFGKDPVAKQERKRLRKLVAENRRLKAEQRILLARMDLLSAESKELKKQFPFKRNRASQE